MVTAKHAARLSKIVSRKNFLFAFAQEMRSGVQQPIEDQAVNRVAIPMSRLGVPTLLSVFASSTWMLA